MPTRTGMSYRSETVPATPDLAVAHDPLCLLTEVERDWLEGIILPDGRVPLPNAVEVFQWEPTVPVRGARDASLSLGYSWDNRARLYLDGGYSILPGYYRVNGRTYHIQNNPMSRRQSYPEIRNGDFTITRCMRDGRRLNAGAIGRSSGVWRVWIRGGGRTTIARRHSDMQALFADRNSIGAALLAYRRRENRCGLCNRHFTPNSNQRFNRGYTLYGLGDTCYDRFRGTYHLV